MKNKLSLKLLSRWMFAPLLVGSLLAWEVSPAYPNNTVSRVAQPQKMNAAAIAAADSSADLQDIKDRIKELEAKERQNFALVLDDQRKKIDWWFSFLAVLTAVMAIGGALIPFLMARKDKEIIEQDKAQVFQMKVDVSKLLSDAKLDTEKIHQHEATVAEIRTQMQSYQSNPEGKTDEAQNADITATVSAVKEDKTADPILRLRAEAISASEANEADKAYALWSALTQLDKEDAIALLNAGYWAGKLSLKLSGSEKLFWLRLVGHHSEQALRLKPDMHLAACNWGTALLTEASAIASSNAEEFKRLLDQAEQLLLKHANAATDAESGKVAYNLACVYGLRGDVQACLQWLRVSHVHKALPDCERLHSDKDLDAVRNAPEFVDWLESVCGSTSSPRTA